MVHREPSETEPRRGGDVERFVFADDGRIPNSRFPLILMRAAVPLGGEEPARPFEGIFAQNGWTGAWRDGIYGYHHYHSTAHEVLGIAQGSARVRFGGDGGETVAIGPGVVAVIPAGVGHKLIDGSRDLLVVGAYAGGRDWDVIRDDPDEIGPARLRIAAVPMPETDPVAGADGPVTRAWRV